MYFVAGKTLALETCALEWGKHYFDYEVQSRETDDLGRPTAIATSERAISREFFERRSVSRLPVPLSFGYTNGNRIPEAQLTLGEVAAQICTSTVSTRKGRMVREFQVPSPRRSSRLGQSCSTP